MVLNTVLLTGSLFFIDLKCKQSSEAELCTSTNTEDLTEGGQEGWRCSTFSPEVGSPILMSSKMRGGSGHSGKWGSLVPQVSWKHDKGHINSCKCKGLQRSGSSCWVVAIVLCNMSTAGPQPLSIWRKLSIKAVSVPVNMSIFI